MVLVISVFVVLLQFDRFLTAESQKILKARAKTSSNANFILVSDRKDTMFFLVISQQLCSRERNFRPSNTSAAVEGRLGRPRCFGRIGSC